MRTLLFAIFTTISVLSFGQNIPLMNGSIMVSDNNVVVYSGSFSSPLTNENYVTINGSDEHIDFGEDAVQIGTSDFSISFWLKIPNYPTAGGYFVSKGSINGRWHIRSITSDRIEFRGYDSGGNLVVRGYSAGTSTDLTDWNHFLIVGDRDDDIYIYVNGVEDTQYSSMSVSDITVSGAQVLELGKLGASYTECYVDLFAFWDSDMSAHAVTLSGQLDGITLSTYTSLSPLNFYPLGEVDDTYSTFYDLGSLEDDGASTNFDASNIVSH